LCSEAGFLPKQIRNAPRTFLHAPHEGGRIRASNNSKINCGNVLFASRRHARLFFAFPKGSKEERMSQPFLALITPLSGGRPDQGLPGGGYYPDQGLPGGGPGGRPDQGFNPDYPSQGLPGGGPGPSHPIVLPGAPPGSPGSPSHPIYITGNPSHPIYVPGYPDQGLPGGQGGVPTHPWVPPEGETLPPPPDDIVNEYVVAVWNPTKAEWTVTIGGATPK
jgi:hypothetical protein